MLEQKFEELRLAGKLPSPTGVGLKILEVTRSEDASLEDVVKILQTDPTLTGRLIQFANSGGISGRTRVTDARTAAMRLGLQTVRTISLGFSLVAANRSGRCKAFAYDEFWPHSLAVAAAAQVVAELRGDVPPADAFTCGLLQGMGRLALASIHHEAYEGVLERARGQSSAVLAQIEHDNFGTNHRELAAAMLHDWRLPDDFCAAVGHVGSGAPAEELQEQKAVALARCLQDARDLARVMTSDIDATPAVCRRMHLAIERMQRGLQCDERGLEDLWKRVLASWAAWGEVMSIRAKTVLSLADIAQRSQAAGDESQVCTPVAEQPVLAAVVPESRRCALRLVLVGPDLLNDHSLREALARDGHEILVAMDEREGLRVTLEHGPHLILSDWDLRGGSGLQLIRTLRQSEIGKRVHAIVVVDGGKEGRLLEAFDAGADEYVLRPLDARLVLARARSALRVVQLDERVQDLMADREQQISQLAIATRKLQVAAITDALTGLFNRRYAVDRLQKAFEISRNGGGPLSVLMLDLDRFKAVNDSFGHDTGDAVLRSTSKVLAGLLRKGDALCRMGGEEFLAICPGTSIATAVRIAERLRAGMSVNIIRFGDYEGTVTMSIGAAELDDSHETVDALLKTADLRVYVAKETGRDRVVCVDAEELVPNSAL